VQNRDVRSALLRFIYTGRVRWALPHTVLEETTEDVALLIVPGVRGRGPKGGENSDYIAELLSGKWRTVEHEWHTNRVVRLTRFAHPYSLDHYWDAATDEFLGYQVNFQQPLRRSRFGFDTLDLELDITVKPDGSWRWKDAAEFEEAERKRIFSEQDIQMVQATAVEVAERLDKLLPTGWEDWRPDPTWPLPTLPRAWGVV